MAAQNVHICQFPVDTMPSILCLVNLPCAQAQIQSSQRAFVQAQIHPLLSYLTYPVLRPLNSFSFMNKG